jgi:putative ABC transport system substrate-binding protein
MLAGLRQGLNELGWIERRNIEFEVRYADGNFDRLPRLAAELVDANVDVIVTGSSSGALAAKNTTDKIPIVMVTTGDPVREGLIASLARPRRNITGITALGQALNEKRLELLKEALPRLNRVAVLINPSSPYTQPFLEHRVAAARALGIEVFTVDARKPSEIEPAFQKIVSLRGDGLMVLTDIVFISHRRQIIDLATKNRLPSIFGERGSVQAGGLMFYGANLPDMYRRSAIYIDKILKGAKPDALPVEQPTKFELVINRRTANALGIEVPPKLLFTADDVIE